MTAPSSRHAIVIGAGVIGLTTAVVLAEADWGVTVLTADDVLATTSAAAGALVGLETGRNARVWRWTTETLGVMTALSVERGTGISLRRGLIAERRPTDVPTAVRSLPGFAVASPSKLPAGFVEGFWLTLPLVDMHRYLLYLTHRVRRAGGELVRRRVRRIRELDGTTDGVVNCSGLGARMLASDETVVPVFGQHLVVNNPGVDHFFIDGLESESDWIAWYPFPEHVVIGGVARDRGSDDLPDLELADRLHTRAADVLPALADAEVIEHRTGLRPERPTIRVERDADSSMPVIHNYGHGRVGVSLSWACARRALGLLTTAVGG